MRGQFARVVFDDKVRSGSFVDVHRSVFIGEKGLKEGVEYEAHHVFPVKYADKFDKAGININDPHYGTWWEKTDHRKKAYEYNQEWNEFFGKMKGKSSEQVNKAIFEKAKELAEKYNFKINFE